MRRLHEYALRLLALALLLAGTGAARADTPIALWKTVDGRVNFTGTQVTLRTKPNTTSNGNGNGKGDACAVAAPSTVRKASLSLPLGATVVSAQLYWAGSGIADSTVTFENRDITAERKFSSTTAGGGFNYFGGAADVTSIVQAKGSGSYGFSGLTVSNGAPWCASQAVLGGFSLLVVYTHPSEPARVLNLYEGFSYLQNSELEVNASNFRWNRTVNAVLEKARVAHISWEGDPTLAKDGERLLFEGTEMTDALNPEGNQFNSRSNINSDSASYGIDFDAFDTTVTISSLYDAVVTTRYRTGQDLVILNAEVLLVPTMPVSDLSIAIARSGALSVGADVQYTITVANKGPVTEAGPITVSNTLPAGMSYVSGGGSGWTCTVSAAAGSCTYGGALAPGATAPVLVVKATVTSAGEKSNTVTVKGSNDDDLSNNTATDTGTATAPATPTPPLPAATPGLTYVFTDKTCTAGVALGAAGQCRKYGADTVGGSTTKIFLTALIDGLPASPSATSETTATLQFKIECVNPGTCKAGAGYAGAAIPATAADPWSPATGVKFPAKTVSLEQDFVYNDVGRIKLHLKGAGTSSTEEFVSAPRRIDFKLISNGTSENPGYVKGSDKGFAQAGAPLTLEVGALLADGKTFAPNFGNESTQAAVVLGQSAAVATLTDQGKLAEIGEATWAGGIRSSKAAWSEVGAVNFVIGLADNLYLGVSTQGSTRAVGRFYPAYFKTDALRPFGCPASLPLTDYPCPQTDTAVYAGQSFDVTVTAYNAANQRVQNFTGEWFRTVTLHAAKTAGGELLASDFTPPAGAAATTIGATTPVPDADGKGSTIAILGKAAYKLADPYSNARPRSARIGDPTTVYVRAVADDSNLAGSVAITSKRGADEVSDEAAILVLNGRLAVPNALGTDILRTPLGLRAEYWAGAKAGWLLNPGYGDPLGADAAKVRFVTCSPSFANADGSCNTTVLAADATKRVALARGAGVLWLRLPGKLDKGVARTGAVTLEYNGWAWLPSTLGRVSFGSHRSPVIYVRELYF